MNKTITVYQCNQADSLLSKRRTGVGESIHHWMVFKLSRLSLSAAKVGLQGESDVSLRSAVRDDGIVDEGLVARRLACQTIIWRDLEERMSPGAVTNSCPGKDEHPLKGRSIRGRGPIRRAEGGTLGLHRSILNKVKLNRSFHGAVTRPPRLVLSTTVLNVHHPPAVTRGSFSHGALLLISPTFWLGSLAIGA